MKKLISTLTFLLAINFYGQDLLNCNKKSLIGEWYYVTGFMEYESTNIDSLIQNIDTLKKLESFISFDENGNYLWKTEQKTRYKFYSLQDTSCNIDYRRRKNSKSFTHKIIYLDDNFLIIRQTNPKAHTVTLYKRKT